MNLKELDFDDVAKIELTEHDDKHFSGSIVLFDE
jgi:hypothetical protein